MRFLLVVSLLFLSACSGRSYHAYQLTQSFKTSSQSPHLLALQQTDSQKNLWRGARACIYYPVELGGFSSGCGELQHNPYQDMLSRR